MGIDCACTKENVDFRYVSGNNDSVSNSNRILYVRSFLLLKLKGAYFFQVRKIFINP